MALAVCLALPGCSGGISNPLPSMTSHLPGWFTASSPTTPTTPTGAEAAETSAAMQNDCPVADIRRGASTLQIATKTEAATATDLRYQLTFTDLARQCTALGQMVRMRVGVQGRVIVGPAGAPSQVDVPLRYAVIREGVEPKTIVTKFKRISVSMPPGAEAATFTDIEEDLSFPMPSISELDKYVVYVGFDEFSERNTRRTPPAKSRRKR